MCFVQTRGIRSKGFEGDTYEEKIPEGGSVATIVEEYFGTFFAAVDGNTDSADCCPVG